MQTVVMACVMCTMTNGYVVICIHLVNSELLVLLFIIKARIDFMVHRIYCATKS